MLRGLVKRNSTRNSILLIFPAIKLVDYLTSRKQDRGETFEDAFGNFQSKHAITKIFQKIRII